MEQPQLPPETTAEPVSHAVRDSDVVDLSDRNDGCCSAVLKRKRGRPAKGLPKTTPPLRQKKDEEDVCFICFDGGSLVLCDRRGCPKAYHPTCIKRDEAFFRSKAKWNCGWHICSNCGKASHYMCYTCTHSLCKGCTKGADFVCVRENKGLCGMCMRTIMLIENSAQGNKAMCEVDFDDKSSWEYLFKVYWMYLKGKLSLTSDELLRAKNPWKVAAPMSCEVQTPHELHHLKVDNGSGSENSCIDIEPNNLENKDTKRRDKHRHFWDGVLNNVARDLSNTCETTGNVCIMKNRINPTEAAIDDCTNAGVVRLEASGVPADISSLRLSTGMEQQISDFVNDKSWHYEDPTGKVQGPFSMLHLCKWNASGHFPPDLRIWRIDEKRDNSILLTDALSGKYSQNVSLPYNGQQLSLGASVTLDNKENRQDGGSSATRNEVHPNNQIVEQTGEQKVDNTCTQSNGKDESVKSNGWHSQSPCCPRPADGNNSEGQSGNFERMKGLLKCQNSGLDGPHLYPALPSAPFSEKSNGNTSDKLREGHGKEGNSEDNGNYGSNRISEGQSNSGQSYQKQSESEENSGQSSGQNWSGPHAFHPWMVSIFGEPDDSVSNLLAEVEKMESLGGLESTTSIMNCGEELTDGSITDCLSFAKGLSPVLDAGKGDALSSTGDLHLPSLSMVAEEPFRQVDVHPHHQKISVEHSSRSSEVESTFSRIGWNPTNQYSWDPNC